MTTPQNEDAKIREDAATFAIRAARVMAIGAGPPNVISIVCACGMVATARKATGHTDQDGARTLARRLVTLIAPGSE
jgi:hypothetical protein